MLFQAAANLCWDVTIQQRALFINIECWKIKTTVKSQGQQEGRSNKPSNCLYANAEGMGNEIGVTLQEGNYDLAGNTEM